jgi:hypothetical protein
MVLMVRTSVWHGSNPILKPKAMPSKDQLYKPSQTNVAGLQSRDFKEQPLDIKGDWYYYNLK